MATFAALRLPLTQKPEPGVGIDWTHPLARGLVFCLPLLEVGSQKVTELVTGSTVAVPSGWSWTNDQSGGALVVPASGSALSFPVNQIVTNATQVKSWLAIVRPLGTQSAGPTTWGVSSFAFYQSQAATGGTSSSVDMYAPSISSVSYNGSTLSWSMSVGVYQTGSSSFVLGTSPYASNLGSTSETSLNVSLTAGTTYYLTARAQSLTQSVNASQYYITGAPPILASASYNSGSYYLYLNIHPNGFSSCNIYIGAVQGGTDLGAAYSVSLSSDPTSYTVSLFGPSPSTFWVRLSIGSYYVDYQCTLGGYTYEQNCYSFVPALTATAGGATIVSVYAGVNANSLTSLAITGAGGTPLVGGGGNSPLFLPPGGGEPPPYQVVAYTPSTGAAAEQGGKARTTSTAYAINGMSSLPANTWTIGTTSGVYPYAIAAFYAWNRPLSQAELQQITAQPYALLQPPPVRRWFGALGTQAQAGFQPAAFTLNAPAQETLSAAAALAPAAFTLNAPTQEQFTTTAAFAPAAFTLNAPAQEQFTTTAAFAPGAFTLSASATAATYLGAAAFAPAPFVLQAAAQEQVITTAAFAPNPFVLAIAAIAPAIGGGALTPAAFTLAATAAAPVYTTAAFAPAPFVLASAATIIVPATASFAPAPFTLAGAAIEIFPEAAGFVLGPFTLASTTREVFPAAGAFLPAPFTFGTAIGYVAPLPWLNLLATLTEAYGPIGGKQVVVLPYQDALCGFVAAR